MTFAVSGCSVAEQSKAVVEEHKKVSAAADSLDEILNPNAAYERAVGVVERFQKMAVSRQVKSACSEVIIAMTKMKDGPQGQQFVKAVTQPVTDVWKEAAKQQKADIPERERRLFELAEQLESGQQSEDYFDLPRRG